MDMDDQKTFIVMEATSDFAVACALSLLQKGARVICVGPSPALSDEARQSMGSYAGQAEYLSCDTSSQDALRALCDGIRQRNPVLDGIFFTCAYTASHYMTTEDGIETQLARHHLAPFLMTHALFDCLKQAGGATIVLCAPLKYADIGVNANDLQMRRRYRIKTQYKRAKRCNILFAQEFNRRFADIPIRACVTDEPRVAAGDAETAERVAGMLMAKSLPQAQATGGGAKSANDAKAVWEASEKLTMTGPWPSDDPAEERP